MWILSSHYAQEPGHRCIGDTSPGSCPQTSFHEGCPSHTDSLYFPHRYCDFSSLYAFGHFVPSVWNSCIFPPNDEKWTYFKLDFFAMLDLLLLPTNHYPRPQHRFFPSQCFFTSYTICLFTPCLFSGMYAPQGEGPHLSMSVFYPGAPMASKCLEYRRHSHSVNSYWVDIWENVSCLKSIFKYFSHV